MEKIGLVVLNQATHYDHLETFKKTDAAVRLLE